MPLRSVPPLGITDRNSPFGDQNDTLNEKTAPKLSVRNVPVSSPTMGMGKEFTKANRAHYRKLKQLTSRPDSAQKIEWILTDLESGQNIARTRNTQSQFFGASISKLFVAATFLDATRSFEDLSRTDLQSLLDMLIVSDNGAWRRLHRAVGKGKEKKSQKLIQGLLQRLGLPKTRGYLGVFEGKTGNKINAKDLNSFLIAIHRKRFRNSDQLLALMMRARLPKQGARKYIPKSVVVGGKDGRFFKEFRHPQTGISAVKSVYHEVLIIHFGPKTYGLTILSQYHSQADISVLCGGIVEEYILKTTKEPISKNRLSSSQ